MKRRSPNKALSLFLFGGDKWNRRLKADGDEQLPLMKQRRNRVAYYKNDCEFGWLRNATKKEFSAAAFAYVDYEMRM